MSRGLVLASRGLLVVALIAAAGLTSATASASALAFNANSQVTTTKPGGWDEPSGITGSDGELYVASQNPNGSPDTLLSQSSDGVSWQDNTNYSNYLNGRAEGQTGDVTMAADHAGTVFLGHLTRELQADIDYTRDDGKTWQTANDVATLASPGAGSNSPGLVDRPWIGVYSPDGNYKHTQVYLEYHDFVTSAIYIVTCSMATGSLQCGAPIPVSNAQTACNSIPGGVAVSPAGSSHPGRVYTVWTTADPQTNATSGCNYTQLAPFYAMYVAWSDTPTDPSSWHQVPVYVGPNGSGENCPQTSPVMGVSTNTCADMSELFTPIAVDNSGNVYVGFIDYIDTIDPHYDVYLERSLDGGNTWDGKSDGSGQPIMVSDAGGTHYTPNLAAGSNGRVAVVYYRTDYATRPFEKGETCPPPSGPPETSCQGKNHPEPASAAWVLDVAESTNASSAAPSFTQVQASDSGTVVHYGDICNLGIYCDGSSSGNRSLFENNTVFPDLNGNIVGAWGDQRLDPLGEQDAGYQPTGPTDMNTAQSKQVAYDEIFATKQAAGPPLFETPLAPTPTPASAPPGVNPPGRHKAGKIKAPRCARPFGQISPRRLGPLTLGMLRPNARHAFRHFSTRNYQYVDFYCFTPGGVRAGYPSRKLLQALPAKQRKRFQNRVVLVLTATPFYALRGVRPGATLAAAKRVLKIGRPFHIGLNYWYLAPYGGSEAAMKVRHGIVEEIGIADPRVTRRRHMAFTFFRSFG